VCLVGESGCGKSVTGLALMRLIDPPGRIQEGSRVTFEGNDLLGLSEKQMERIRGNDIAMVFQEPMSSLNPVQTVGAQIVEAVRLHQDVSRKAARAQAEEALALVGMPSPKERMGNYPHEMSGGMRQRVVIAMAIVCRPKLHITHDLGVVAETADRVAVAYGGRVVEEGSAAEIYGHPQHPYTEALLRSIPVLGMTHTQHPLSVIRGMVPGGAHWPSGCRFAPRCDHSFDLCAEYPRMVDLSSGQSAACWLCESGPRSLTTLPTAGLADV
jgi:oligopeptide/dipeptide ABC transporter ATP-binding protein